MISNVTITAARIIVAVSTVPLMTSCAFWDRSEPSPGPQAQILAPSEPIAAAAYPVSHDNAFQSIMVHSRHINPGAPGRYTVKPGDTLWDVSAQFLKEPWLWPEVWGHNPQISNPHLIYPGDELALQLIGQDSKLSLRRAARNTTAQRASEPSLGAATPDNERFRLSPRIRIESTENAIPVIAGDTINAMLSHPRVVDAKTIESAPYVVANDQGRLISSIGSEIYVRGPVNPRQTAYGVFRVAEPLTDPINKEKLGYELIHVADAQLLNIGNPSTLGITRNKMETISGDIVLPLNANPSAHFYKPRLPQVDGNARIISLVDGLSRSGRNQTVILNVGSASDIAVGDVLGVETRGRLITDKLKRFGPRKLELPDKRTGVLMVFRVFDRVSYALVMESTEPVRVNDTVTGL